MEMMLQYNADHVRLIRHMFQFFQDSEIYGVAILRTGWKSQKARRTVWKQNSGMVSGVLGLIGMGSKGKFIKMQETRTVFEGTEVFSQDPFMFFPDPRVPMSEVNRKGEFVFWRTDSGKHELRRMEQEGLVKWVDRIPGSPAMNESSAVGGISERSLLSEGDPRPGRNGDRLVAGEDFVQIDQGTIEIVPSKLGLGVSDKMEKWIFSIGNRGQIIQAEPLDDDHGLHPVAVTEPYTMGYGFGQPGLSDYLGPLQDTVSWFINSHIMNVRASLNNMFVVDPSMVEMQDLKNPEPGKLIRLKRAAYGQDVRQAISQFAVQDVTGQHVDDMRVIMRMGDMLSSVVDNVRGLQDAGGRKTATEVRTSMEAASSRLASHARLISAQGITDLATMMVLNYQQNMSEEFYEVMMGKPGDTVKISPETLSADFTFPINDGTLPVDKVALLDVWKELFTSIASDQQLRPLYDLPKMFEFIAELGGAQNIKGMRLQQNPQVEQQVQAGNMVPVDQMGKDIASALG